MLSIIQAAGWPIWPLVACSILALALVIERFISLKDSRIAPPRLLDEALSVSRTAVPTPDVVRQLEQNSALGEVLASGFRALNSDPRCTEADLRANMESTAGPWPTAWSATSTRWRPSPRRRPCWACSAR